MYSRRGRRRLIRAYLLGLASVLLIEGLVAGVALWPPTSTATGNAHIAPSPEAAAGLPGPDPGAPAPPPAQAPGTVRLPGGGTAFLIRQYVVDGVLPIPDRLDQAAWWGADLEAARGASVFAGHVNWGGRPGPFAELWTERIGQEVIVVDGTGKPSSYRISQLFSLGKDELPQRAPDLFAQTGQHRLVLVTCGGEWVGGAQGYAQNRVVIADPA
ncbi:class F sortase [Amycolatopsis pigmentata]|uniref:Class F sortase n=1 Tax=Amycolatopsis pigmentata TaxID=450801 RepID=A0ABW5FWA3_9PSEU